MTVYSEYDPIGELFRQRLENHRVPVDENGWDEIERRMGKKKRKAVIWLLRGGVLAAAASIALLALFYRPASDETALTIVSTEASEIQLLDNPNPEIHSGQSFNDENIQVLPSVISQARFTTPKNDVEKIASSVQRLNDSEIHLFNDSESQSFHDSLDHTFDHPVVAEKEMPPFDFSPFEDRADDDETDAKEGKRWLFAAALGTGGYTNDFTNILDNSVSLDSDRSMALNGSGNSYASRMSDNIQSFNNMRRNEFTKIRHLPPLSFGLTVRNSLAKGGGVESGLIYTYLASQYQWAGYDVHQGLHYVGIPVNAVVYLWKSNPNWRVYISGGFMVEKGLRGVYKQERQQEREHRITTVKRSINGLQWSLNGALGVNYRLEKGWGIYFEPRIGYSLDSDQPVSIRTEWPVYVGINLGLNYELQ